MPKRKTGARKKKERQAEVLAAIRTGGRRLVLSKAPCNDTFQCGACGRRQKNRWACYFCKTVQRMPACGECGRNKCQLGTGECAVAHQGTSATGMRLVGAICDHCEAFVCHSKRCLQKHGCPECPLEGAKCVGCTRGVWDTGGCFYQCGTCEGWLCEDCQFEHQASCTYLDAGTYQCASCSRFGTFSCLKCKVAFCDAHRDGAFKVEKGAEPRCKRCRGPLRVTKDHSVSTRTHNFGRSAGGGNGASASATAHAAAAAARAAGRESKEEEEEVDDEDEDEDEDEDGGDDDDDDEAVERLTTEFGEFAIAKYGGAVVDRSRFTFGGKRVAGGGAAEAGDGE